MTVTTYYVTHKLGHPDAEANAILHLINDLAFSSGDNRSWDATRAHVDALADAEMQARYRITVEAEQSELVPED